MGATLTAPLSALGACFGTCCAAGCCQLAKSGSVDTTKGARCLLLWLQMSFLAFAIPLMSASHNYLDQPCEMYSTYVGGVIGICECGNVGTGDAVVNACRQDQLVLRATASIEAIMIFQVLLAVSGCAASAALGLPVAKFMALPVLWLLFLFVPNSLFTSLGFVSSLIGAGFFPAQALLAVDFLYSWNASWFEFSNAERRANPRGRKYMAWLVGLVIFAVVFIGAALYLAIQLSNTYTTSGERALVWATFGISVVLLVVSITEWCKHGVLLVSAGVMFFVQWLVWQTLPMGGDETSFAPPVWAEFLVGFLTLVVLITYNAGSAEPTTVPAAAVELAPQVDEEASVGGGKGKERVIIVAAPAAETAAPKVDAYDFSIQCLIQLTAAAYLTSIFAPNVSTASYVLHIVTVSCSLALYGWVLIAPMVLKNRQFNY